MRLIYVSAIFPQLSFLKNVNKYFGMCPWRSTKDYYCFIVSYSHAMSETYIHTISDLSFLEA